LFANDPQPGAFGFGQCSWFEWIYWNWNHRRWRRFGFVGSTSTSTVRRFEALLCSTSTIAAITATARRRGQEGPLEGQGHGPFVRIEISYGIPQNFNRLVMRKQHYQDTSVLANAIRDPKGSIHAPCQNVHPTLQQLITVKEPIGDVLGDIVTQHQNGASIMSSSDILVLVLDRKDGRMCTLTLLWTLTLMSNPPTRRRQRPIRSDP
jgi:hypothetical protein